MEKKNRNKIILVIIVVVMTVICLTVGIIVTTNIKNEKEQKEIAEWEERNKRIVPNVVGMTRKEAIEELEKNELDHVVSPYTIIDDNAVVTSQSPKAGEEIKKDDRVTINVKKIITEKSDTSFTGLVFNKDFSDFKNQLSSYIENTYKDSIGTLVDTNIEIVSEHKQEDIEYKILSFRRFRNSTQPYDVASITINVDYSTNKIISINFYCLNSVSLSDYMADYACILDLIGSDLRYNVSEFVKNYENSKSYYKDNVYVYATGNNNQTCTFVLATDEKEAEYHTKNNSWKKFNN